MPTSLPDVYVNTVSSGVAFQGATKRGIEAVAKLSASLINGTIAVIQGDQAVEEAFAALDATGIRPHALG
jgi:hypothetical protein